jgi:signal transduction histidine kinase/ligand-binding sensor domain-containing protein
MHIGYRRALIFLLTTGFGLTALSVVQALPSDRLLTQLKHSTWTISDGAPQNVTALAQSKDGFLWLGATTGLYRFDGLKFEYVPMIDAESSVTALMYSSAGELWVGLQNGHIVVLQGDHQIDRSPDPKLKQVGSIVEARDGSIWVDNAQTGFHLLRFADQHWQNFGTKQGLPDDLAIFAAPTGDGSFYVLHEHGLYVLKPGNKVFEQSRILDPAIEALIAKDRWQDDDKNLFVPAAVIAALPEPPNTFINWQRTFLFDGPSKVWATTLGSGVSRGQAPFKMGEIVTEQFAAKDGLTSNTAESLLEDHEGNIWIGTSSGVDRFSIANIVVEAGPKPSEEGFIIVGDRRGIVFIADGTTLYRVSPHEKPMAVLHGIDNPMAICDDDGANTWVGAYKQIYRIAPDGVTAHVAPIEGMRAFDKCESDSNGRPWFLSTAGRLFYFDNDKWIPKPITLAPNERLTKFSFDSKGRLIAFIDNKGLARVDDEAHTLWAYGDVPGGRMGMIYVGDHQTLLGSVAGLARLRNDQVEQLPGNYPWLRHVTGMIEDSLGGTWLQSSTGIYRVSTQDLDRAFTDSGMSLVPEIFDSNDGLPGPNQLGYAQNGAARGGDGRLWFATQNGVAWIDPANLVKNPVAPPVRLTRVIIDNRIYSDPQSLDLKQDAKSLEIDFSVLSLQVPERNQVRYRLEGVDAEWVDPGLRRQAFYTQLPPGRYRFTVIGSNNDGVWNKVGAMVTLLQAPRFYQTLWFRALCGALGLAAFWIAYRLRLSSITSRMQTRLDSRLAERERIARDLHDTLLQGVHGLLLRFQSIADRMQGHDLAKPMEIALERAEDMMIESRERLLDLRTPATRRDLSELLSAAASEAGLDGSIKVKLSVTGNSLPVDPGVAEEVSAIALESLINARRHAEAKQVEVSVTYTRWRLTVAVRDDGKGIDPEVLIVGGREGHFGLLGMRERAKRIRSRLQIQRNPGGGTVVRIVVPGYIAYRAGWLTRFWPTLTAVSMGPRP